MKPATPGTTIVSRLVIQKKAAVFDSSIVRMVNGGTKTEKTVKTKRERNVKTARTRIQNVKEKQGLPTKNVLILAVRKKTVAMNMRKRTATVKRKGKTAFRSKKRDFED